MVAVLAASLGSFLVARNTLLQAADNSLTTAAQTVLAGPGDRLDHGHARAGDRHHRRRRLGRRPAGHRAGAAGGQRPRPGLLHHRDRGREPDARVRRAPPGRARRCQSGILVNGGALQIATLLNVNSELRTLALLLGVVAFVGVLLAVVLGWLVARTALVPLNSLTDTVEDLAETTDVSRRLSPGGPDELGRLRRTFNRLLEALESSRRAQSQLVLDASHELRTPLTSLRTNLEVIRRVDELSVEDRSVLVDDVLVQLQELTDIVGDLAELARGDQEPTRRGAAPPRPARQRRGRRAEHPRPRQGRLLRPRRGALLGRGPPGPPQPCRGQPPRQRPQVEPAGQERVGRVPRRGRSSCTTRAPASRRATCPTSSTASTGPRPPGACPGRASAWPSWPRWSRPRAGPSRPRTTRRAGRGCRCGCRRCPLRATPTCAPVGRRRLAPSRPTPTRAVPGDADLRPSPADD